MENKGIVDVAAQNREILANSQMDEDLPHSEMEGNSVSVLEG